jgi:hypothetical protein
MEAAQAAVIQGETTMDKDWQVPLTGERAKGRRGAGHRPLVPSMDVL